MHLADFEDFGRVRFEIQPFETPGGMQQREVANLNEHQATLLITFMRNSEIVKEFKKKLVKAFFEYAQQERQPIDPMQALSDPAVMRGLLLGYTEKVIALEEKVAEQAPKVEVHDRLVSAEGCMNPTLAAKALQTPPRRLFDLMRSSKWIYRRPGGSGNIAYQDKIQAGYLTHKVTTVQREDGSDKIIEQVLVTPKGLTKLAQMLAN